MRLHVRVAVSSLVWICFGLSSAHAAEAWQEYDKIINGRQVIGALGPTLFGDNVNLASGALSFSTTDVSISGNNALPVAVTRTFGVKSKAGFPDPDRTIDDGHFGDWELDLPNISGVYATATGWVNARSDRRPLRCSVATTAEGGSPSVTIGTSPFGGEMIWQGNRLNIPGKGSDAMLVARTTTAKPASGGPYYWTTKNWTSVSCLPSIQNGTGEGFLAVTTDGTRYWFNQMSAASAAHLRQKRVSNPGYDELTRKRYGLYATRVEDRFGNWVTYSYNNGPDAPVRLTSIDSSDGRQITLSYLLDRVSSVSDGARTWQYQYSGSSLVGVVLPDGSRWTIAFGGLNPVLGYYTGEPGEPWRDCNNPGDVRPNLNPTVGTITHPSGATGEFTISPVRFWRSNVPAFCATGDPNTTNDDVSWYPNVWDAFALIRKHVTGPGIPAADWSYSYGSSITAVTGPGTYTQYTFGTSFRSDEGQLLSMQIGSSPADITKSETYVYQPAPTTPIGDSPQVRSDDFTEEYPRPQLSDAISQQGVTFKSQVNLPFDAFWRPLSVTKSSTPGSSKTDTIDYSDNPSSWVLGQVKKTTTDNIITSETYYDPTTALPLWSKAFGKLQQTLSYNFAAGTQAGTVATVKDGRNNTTTLSNWKRGIPQTIGYPDGTSESAVVDNNGWIESVTNENGTGYTTNYTYDAMGRLASIAYPTGDSTVWATTTLSFLPIAADEYGLPAGHWKQTVSTGNARKNTYFDAMWRPVVVESFDAADSATTLSQIVKRYDAAGHLVYQSYPMRGLTGYTVPTQGARTFYDALDRVTRAEQDSELGVLATTTVYQAGFQTQTTNPRLQSTTTSYRAYDQPSTDWPVAITHPEGAYTNIDRDVFGKPRSLTRRDVASSLTLSRYFVYDANQQLCKTVEPETAATVMDYDAAGNVMWSASGLSYLSTAACDTLSVPTAVKVNRTYDSRNRVQSLSFPDSNGNQSWSYTPDGLPAQVTTLNDTTAGLTSAINAFAYNKRRLLTGESLEQPGLYTWSIGYGYNANGQLANHTSPGLTVDYAPNALGQPTQAGSYATAVSYFPNGAMAQFTYGNGIVHTLAQNARGLPDRSRDAFGATAVHDDSYDYDPNGNVLAISDGLLGNRGNRDMTYDGLDRLTGTVSPMFSPASYGYDVLDNLKTVKVAGRDHTYVYDPSWRLTNVTNTVGGASVIGLAYDAQGNLANKNGQLYRFDYGNRLREATNKETYRYDGNGRRIQAAHQSLDTIYSLYGQDGVLRYQQDYRKQQVSSYVYLNGSLVARLANPANLTTAPVLSAPTNSSNGAYTVNWSTVSGANRYRLEESINNGVWSQVADTVAVSWNTSGKADGNYRYRARSCFLGCSAYSAIASTTVALLPASAPVISAPTLSTNGIYTVNWGSVSLATRYELNEQVGGGAWVEILNASATSKALSGKATGNYGYRVRACNNAGCSIWSDTATVSVTLPPGGPSSFTVPAQGLNGAYTVSWGTASGATSYTLEESPNGGAWVIAYSGLAQSQAFSGRAAGTYGYRIKACNASGCSAVTGTGTVTVVYPPATAPSPSAPSQGLNGAYAVSWTAVSGATSYQLDESANGGAWILIYNAAGTSTGFSGKPVGNYSYRARACNAAGCGPTSGTVAVAVIYPPAIAPSPSVPGQSSNGSYTVSWTAVGGATSYQMDESANGGAWSLLYNAGGTSMAMSGKAAGNYAYRARACNAAGCGPTSGSASVVVTYPPSTAPSPTTPAQNYSGAYTASWTAVGTATSYQLEESANGGAWILVYNAGGWSAALSGKATGSYDYRVKACNVGGCGPISATVTTQVVFAPTAAPVVTTPANVVTSGYTVSWNAVAAATSYQVWEQVNGGAWAQIVDANVTSQAVGGKINATYGYQARGCNVGGCGPWSTVATTVVNVPLPIPAMPGSLTGERDVNEDVRPIQYTYYVYWSSSSGATRYELQSGTSTPTIVYIGTGLSYQSTGYGPRTYQVRACNVSGCSSWQGPLSL